MRIIFETSSHVKSEMTGESQLKGNDLKIVMWIRKTKTSYILLACSFESICLCTRQDLTNIDLST